MKIDAGYDKLQDALELSEQQRLVLGQYLRTEGFALILRMWRDEVRKFTEVALASNMADEKIALEALRKAKVAAQIYQGWVDRLNQELAFLESETSGIGTKESPENYTHIEELQ